MTTQPDSGEGANPATDEDLDPFSKPAFARFSEPDRTKHRVEKRKYALERRKLWATTGTALLSAITSIVVGTCVATNLKSLDREKLEEEMAPRIAGSLALTHLEHCDSPENSPTVDFFANVEIKNVGWRPLFVDCAIFEFRLVDRDSDAGQQQPIALQPIDYTLSGTNFAELDAGVRVQRSAEQTRIIVGTCDGRPTTAYAHDEAYKTTAGWRVRLDPQWRGSRVVSAEVVVRWCRNNKENEVVCSDGTARSAHHWSFSSLVDLARYPRFPSDGWCQPNERLSPQFGDGGADGGVGQR